MRVSAAEGREWRAASKGMDGGGSELVRLSVLAYLERGNENRDAALGREVRRMVEAGR